MSPLRVGLVGPDQTQPCGIADYTARLREALAARCDLVFAPYRDALDGRLDGCGALLVQYERSLVRGWEFLPRLGRRYPGKVYVVPHEVYAQDPFAFPYSGLRPPLLGLKRLRYRWSHREYAREEELQRRGYWAEGVIPLSGPGAELLRAKGGKVLEAVPLPSPPLPTGNASAGADDAAAGAFFARPPGAIIGIFGFLNPSHDYEAALDLLAALDPGVGLLLLGGYREGERVGEKVLAGAAARGLSGRVAITGYLPRENLQAHLRLCRLFLAPLKFKSSSASLLDLFHLGRPILASDLPLMRYLREQGAPLHLYADAADLRAKAESALAGTLAAPPNRYGWSLERVAEAYLRVLAGGAAPSS